MSSYWKIYNFILELKSPFVYIGRLNLQFIDLFDVLNQFIVGLLLQVG